MRKQQLTHTDTVVRAWPKDRMRFNSTSFISEVQCYRRLLSLTSLLSGALSGRGRESHPWLLTHGEKEALAYISRRTPLFETEKGYGEFNNKATRVLETGLLIASRDIAKYEVRILLDTCKM